MSEERERLVAILNNCRFPNISAIQLRCIADYVVTAGWRPASAVWEEAAGEIEGMAETYSDCSVGYAIGEIAAALRQRAKP